MPRLVTMNVSVEQIERDLRAGKSIEEIAQDWSEPRANVYAVKRALDTAAAGDGDSTPASVPPRPRPAPVPATADAGLLALVNEASQSKRARTRSLGAKLREARAKLGGRSSAPVNRSKAGSAGGKSTRPVYEGGPTTAEVRAWATAAGIEHPTHGTLPKRVIEAYRAAAGEQ